MDNDSRHRWTKRTVSWLLLALLPGGALSQGLGQFYDDSTLARLQQIYPANIQWNLDQVILPQLYPAERQRLEGVRLRFPLRDPRADPFSYYSSRRGEQATVSMSILSIKFLDDLAVAHAWLESKGYSAETVPDYLGVLKYRREAAFDSGRYPLPLEALGIPKDATRDAMTDDVATKIVKSAVVFTLAHELGHLHYGHPGYDSTVTRQQAQANEVEADSFAIEVFRRLGVAPAGVVYLFEVATYYGSNRGDYDSDSAWSFYQRSVATHPLTGTRLQRLSRELRRSPDDFLKYETHLDAARDRVLLIAAQLDSLGRLFDGGDLQRWHRLRGERIPLRELQPRRPGMSWNPP